MQFRHVSRHPRVLSKKTKEKMFRDNCLENMVSDLWKNCLCVQKTTFRKKCENKQKKWTNKRWKPPQSLADYGDKTTSSFGFLKPHIQNSFP